MNRAWVVGGVVAVLAVASCTSRVVTDAGASADDAGADGGVDAGVYVLTEVMVPMRDGVRLHGWLVREPTDASFPVQLVRNPYGMDDFIREHLSEAGRPGMAMFWVTERGRFESEGDFANFEPRPAASEDTYDLIDWVVKQPGIAPRVVTAGTSYPGWTSLMSARTPHPAQKALIECATIGDAWMGDDLFHHGAFRVAYAVEWLTYLEGDKKQDTLFAFNRRDLYDWYLGVGPLSNFDERFFHGKMPSWNNMVAHPSRDAWWQARDAARVIANAKPTIPALHVAGLFDQEDPYGPLASYAAMEANDDSHRNFLILGPWFHGGWFDAAEKIGDIPLDARTGEEFKATVNVWEAHFLHEDGGLPLPEARVFLTGANQWRSFEKWPPASTPRRVYLRANHRVAFEAPSEATGFDEYVSDPKKPVPFSPRPIPPLLSNTDDWHTWLVRDQRFVDGRPDVVTWESELLDADLTVVGDIRVDLRAATSGTDSDWVVKLIDVFPETETFELDGGTDGGADLRGYQLMVAGDIFRGRYRESFENPVALTANKVLRYDFSLGQKAHVFKAGHRVMVQIHSTWFPLYDRNPQKFVPNIMQARADDFVTATQRISRSKGEPTSIVLPVLEK